MNKDRMGKTPAAFDDTQYVNAARHGETAAWNALYRRHYPGAFAAALRICKDKEAAADAVQDAFVTAFLKLGQLKDPNRFGGWLRQIVTHACFRAVTQHRKQVGTNSTLLQTDAFWDDHIRKSHDQVASQSRLHSALASLPEVLQGTLLLRYFSAFHAYEDIALILGIPVGTVRSRLNQARLKLGEWWKRHEDATDADLERSNEWNDFYLYTYGSMHAHDASRKQFISHLKDSAISFTNGQRFSGGGVIEKMVADDQRAGSWLEPATVFSSGNISIIDTVHFNSSQHPGHCPATSVVVLYRQGGMASQVFVHPSQK